MDVQPLFFSWRRPTGWNVLVYCISSMLRELLRNFFRSLMTQQWASTISCTNAQSQIPCIQYILYVHIYIHVHVYICTYNITILQYYHSWISHNHCTFGQHLYTLLACQSTTADQVCYTHVNILVARDCESTCEYLPQCLLGITLHWHPLCSFGCGLWKSRYSDPGQDNMIRWRVQGVPNVK